ncbi:MAG: glycoside hydrolase family 95 protein [Vicinamibacterales bacterium]|nr:glycoside hydrolase family 95 protein [Vicinamibacterales bacterium]
MVKQPTGSWRLGVLVVLVLAVSVWAAGPMPPPPGSTPASLSLWYDKPTRAFEEALPLGNGRLGAMVFGDIASERVMLNDATLWAGGPVEPRVNPDAITYLPRVREALFKEDYRLADELTRKLQGRYSQSYAPLGDLYIDAPVAPAGPTSAFRRQLDIGSATARTAFTTGLAEYAREYFVSYPDRVLVIRLTASEPGALTFTLRADSQLHRTVQVDSSGDLLLIGRAPVHAEPNYRRDIKEPLVYDDGPDGKGMRFAARIRVLATDGRVTRESASVSVSQAREALVVVAVET